MKVLTAAAAALCVLFAAGNGAGADRKDRPEAEEISRLISGAVVYEHRGGIYTTVIGESEPRLLAARGTYPRWSPDGRHVAFVRGTSIMRMTAEGEKEEILTEADEARAVAYHRNGAEILFTDGKAIKSVSVKDRHVRTVAEGPPFMELGMSADGRWLAVTGKRIGFHIYVIDLKRNKRTRLARGCSASLSPDGMLVTRNSGDHNSLDLLSRENGEKQMVIRSPAGYRFDNQFWSNHGDWLASRSEGKREEIFVHRISTGKAYRMTYSGGCDRPDLFVKGERGSEDP